MNPENIHEDNYLNSIKKFFIPFIILNMIAIVLGASAVNIINIVIRSKAATSRSLLTEIPQRQLSEAEISALPLTETALSVQQNEVVYELPNVLEKTAEFASQTDLTEIDTSLLKEAEALESIENLEQLLKNGQALELGKDGTKPLNKSRLPIVEQGKENPPNEFTRKPEKRLLILPTLNITSEVLDVPITNGNWDISQIDDDSGILDGFASDPTDSEALVIAAHATTNWPTAGPFAELRTMSLGDPIIFQLGTTEYVYEVSRFLRVSTSDVDVLKKNGESGIVLVTCGSYNFFTGEYGSRLIVYGELVETRETLTQTSN